MGIIDIENTCVIAEDNNFDDNELRTLFLKQNIDFNAVNYTGKSQFGQFSIKTTQSCF